MNIDEIDDFTTFSTKECVYSTTYFLLRKGNYFLSNFDSNGNVDHSLYTSEAVKFTDENKADSVNALFDYEYEIFTDVGYNLNHYDKEVKNSPFIIESSQSTILPSGTKIPKYLRSITYYSHHTDYYFTDKVEKALEIKDQNSALKITKDIGGGIIVKKIFIKS